MDGYQKVTRSILDSLAGVEWIHHRHAPEHALYWQKHMKESAKCDMLILIATITSWQHTQHKVKLIKSASSIDD